MALSYFANRNRRPTDQDLVMVLEESHSIWKTIVNYLYNHYKDISEEWKFSGKEYGWSLRIKCKKRNVIYLIPGQKSFKFAFVFLQSTVDAIMNSSVSGEIKNELSATRAYNEGVGFRMDIKDDHLLDDIMELIKLKIESIGQ